MAVSCREQQERVEEEVIRPVDRMARQLRESCRRERCKWWMLCLNVLVCWMGWVLVKICEWVVMLIVRWVYRIVCIIVSLVIGIVLLLTGNPDVLIRALLDLFELVRDAVLFVAGLVLFVGNNVIDFVLTLLNVQDKKRPLTKEELAILRPIFEDSILYTAIRINEGRLGIMGPPFATSSGATTIGYNIYSRTTPINAVTLVHECVHVWQFQFGGTHYIGQSVATQLLNKAGIIRSPYFWEEQIGTARNSWYLLDNVEAQAEFVEDLFSQGKFIFNTQPPNTANGAFFRIADDGENEFTFSRDGNGNPSDTGNDFTEIANEAWRIIRTG